MKTKRMNPWLLLALLMSVSQAVIFPEHARNGKLWALIQAQNEQLFSVTAPELWFSQQVDHFQTHDRQISATFQQRYYELNTFWKSPEGPVILYIGGEGALNDAPQGFVQVLAQKFGAKVQTPRLGLIPPSKRSCGCRSWRWSTASTAKASLTATSRRRTTST